MTDWKKKQYVLTRDVTRKECPWLSGDHAAGEFIYIFYGATYGCCGDGTAVCYVPDGPFFEVPNDSFEAV